MKLSRTCPMIAKIILQKHGKIMRVLSEPIWDGSYMKLDLMAMYVCRYNHKKIMLGVNLSAQFCFDWQDNEIKFKGL